MGLGAASLLGETRYSNETDLEFYLKDPLMGRGEQRLSKKEQMEEFMFLGLRTTKGVSKALFQETFGCSVMEIYGPVLEKNVTDGLLEKDEAFVRLTARGMDLGNYVSAQFLLDE